MDGPCDHFLSGAAFALDEDGGVAGADFGDLVAEFSHHERLADEFAGVADIVDGASQGFIFAAELAVLDGAFDEQFDFVGVEGFLDVIEGAELHGFDGGRDGGEGGHEDDGHIVAEVADLPEYLSERGFRARYGELGSPAYVAEMARIQARVAQLPLYQGKNGS